MAESADTELLPIPSDPRAAQSKRAWSSLLAALIAGLAVVSSLWRSNDSPSLAGLGLAIAAAGFFLALNAGASRHGKLGIVVNAMLLLFVCGYLLGRKG